MYVIEIPNCRMVRILIRNSHVNGLSYRVGPMGDPILITRDKNARFCQTINRLYCLLISR